MISQKKWCSNAKRNVVRTYSSFVDYLANKWQITVKWERSKYQEELTIPFIPTEQEIDQLIGSCKSQNIATLLQTLKETGMRMGEAR